MSLRLRALIVGALLILTVGAIAVANDFYTHGSFPSPGSPATSASMRAELDLISAGFDKLPSFSGNANKAVIINGSANGATVTTGTLSLAGNFAISGAFATTLTVTGSTNVTLPLTGTLATLANTETLTNKTLTSSTLSGTFAGTYTLAGTPTISSVINLTSGGMAFPSTQVASAGANTLDDYEEGTWTPDVGGSATYTVQEGYYVKIGQLVTVTCNMTVNAIGTGSATTISGLPFTTGAGTYTGALFWSTAAVAPVYAIARANTSSNTVVLQGITAANASISNISLMGSGTNVRFSIAYRASS